MQILSARREMRPAISKRCLSDDLASTLCDYTTQDTEDPSKKADRRRFRCTWWPRYFFVLNVILLFMCSYMLYVETHENIGDGEEPQEPLVHRAKSKKLVVEKLLSAGGRKGMPRNEGSGTPNRTELVDEDDDPLVEFGVAGNEVTFSEAFKGNVPRRAKENKSLKDLQLQEDVEAKAGRFSRHQVRLFIAVTATACSNKSRIRRKAIRETWGEDAKEFGPQVKVRFFIGQPDGCSEEDKALLKKEVQDHGDIVFIRQHDIYGNLFVKTQAMLKYYLSDPGKYTHVLKTDEDVYVRISKMIDTLIEPESRVPYLNYVYKGCIENAIGFKPFREPTSKWYQSEKEFPDEMASELLGIKNNAGWGYVLSRDVVFHAMKKWQEWEKKPTTAPAWKEKFNNLEDIMVGILVHDYIEPNNDPRFIPNWKNCNPDVVLVHLDLDTDLLGVIHEQDKIGLWDKRRITCSSGSFEPEDYDGWFKWRNSVVGDGQKITF